MTNGGSYILLTQVWAVVNWGGSLKSPSNLHHGGLSQNVRVWQDHKSDMKKLHLQPNFVFHMKIIMRTILFLNAIFHIFLQMEKEKSQAARAALVRKHKQMACIKKSADQKKWLSRNKNHSTDVTKSPWSFLSPEGKSGCCISASVYCVEPLWCGWVQVKCCC